MYSFSSPQTVYFGRGSSKKTIALAEQYGTKVLVVHGANVDRVHWLIMACTTADLTIKTVQCCHEPRIADIEQALVAVEGFHPSVVIALGGGSVMDFGKALAALIPCDGSPQEYLEIVGNGRQLEHVSIPMIALPTTAGTGAEVTNNAVILIPSYGLKVSLRDPRMIPNIAIVDPSLMQGAPKHVALCAGIDAVTQVIEPYLTVKANPMTDALCRAAIPVGLRVLRDIVEKGCPDGWDSMAWVSTCGGLALANAGLGAVHGFAGVIGGKTNAPHGEICGALLPAVIAVHLRHAKKDTCMYERINWVAEQIDIYFGHSQKGRGLDELQKWTSQMGLRRLSDLGVNEKDFPIIARAAANSSSMRGNPFLLLQPELEQILYMAS